MMDYPVVPFQGYSPFSLYQSQEEALEAIQRIGVSYTIEIWDNAECTNPVPWTVVLLEDQLQLFFAKDKLFEIYFCNDCKGKLPNGISLGMPLAEALKIDPALRFDDWEELYRSPMGYWLEDDLDTKAVMSITIFIREAMDDDLFSQYAW